MGTQENVKLVQDLVQARQGRDEGRYSQLWADDAVIRFAGVPRGLGGVTQGREQILANFRQQQEAPRVEIRDIFADDRHACAILKVAGTFNGTEHFRGTGKPFSTYQAAVYDLEGGRIKQETVYTNFLDVFVQAGAVPLNSLTSGQ